LATYADNRSDEAWPSQETLASDMGDISTDTVRRVTKELQVAGFLLVQTRRAQEKTHLYTLLSGRSEPTASNDHPAPVQPTHPAPTQGELYSNELYLNKTSERRKKASLSVLRQATELIEQSPLATTASSNALCALLATRIGDYRGNGAQPAVTVKWRRDMALLLHRGPLGRAVPEPMPDWRVEAAIRYVFDNMAEPENGTFCWAAQVQSPGALRRHWDKIADAAKRQRASSVATIRLPQQEGQASITVPSFIKEIE